MPALSSTFNNRTSPLASAALYCACSFRANRRSTMASFPDIRMATGPCITSVPVKTASSPR
eukprot:6490667-Amphidinium_carterae.1